MCQAYDAEYRFINWLEKSGYSYLCRKCWQRSYLQTDRCSYCEAKVKEEQP